MFLLLDEDQRLFLLVLIHLILEHFDEHFVFVHLVHTCDIVEGLPHVCARSSDNADLKEEIVVQELPESDEGRWQRTWQFADCAAAW